MQKAILKKIHLCFISVFGFIINCSSNDQHKFTTKICDTYYVESHRIYGSGAFGGDIHRHLLTDSLTFRVIVGEFDTYDHFYSYQCNGDTLKFFFVQILQDSNRIISTKNILSSQLSSLNNLSIEVEDLPKIF